MGNEPHQADIEQAIVALEEFEDQGRLPDEIAQALKAGTNSDPLEMLGQALEHI